VGASTGIVLAAGGITLANELIGASLGKQKWSAATVNWRVIPATAGLALALGALEKIAPQFATGLALLTLFTVLVVPLGAHPTVLANASKLLGY
jgi:hypothetical protein